MRPTGERLNRPGGLTERLFQLRKAAGLTGPRLAGQLGWPTSKVSKLENGRQLPTEADVTGWAQAAGQPDAIPELLELVAEARAVHRLQRLPGGRAAIQDELGRLVQDAKRIRNVETLFIPGLLQTPDYARYRFLEAARNRGLPAGQVDATVAARMRRQEVLYQGGREFEFTFTEVALLLRVCPDDAMLGQLDRLMMATGLPGTRVGIIPLDAPLEVLPDMGFLLVDDVAYIEMPTSDDFRYGQEAAMYARIADAALAESVSGDDARALIARAADRIRRRAEG